MKILFFQKSDKGLKNKTAFSCGETKAEEPEEPGVIIRRDEIVLIVLGVTAEWWCLHGKTENLVLAKHWTLTITSRNATLASGAEELLYFKVI